MTRHFSLSIIQREVPCKSLTGCYIGGTFRVQRQYFTKTAKENQIKEDNGNIRYRDIKIALQRIVNETSTETVSKKPQSRFSNQLSDFLSKLTTLSHRRNKSILTDLFDSFTSLATGRFYLYFFIS